jgi:hypothetical protein
VLGRVNNAEDESMKNTSQFLRLLDEDIKAGNVKKIYSSVFNRISTIKQKAHLARTKQDNCKPVN